MNFNEGGIHAYTSLPPCSPLVGQCPLLMFQGVRGISELFNIFVTLGSRAMTLERSHYIHDVKGSGLSSYFTE
jgi:hypothetical protein